MFDDAWIKVRFLDGTESTLGVTDCLRESKRIKEIRCPGNVHMETYAIHRFLIALLVDAYKVRTMRQIKKLFENGLDMDVLSAYRSDCEKDGISFDVFDEGRPFMQVPAGQVPKELKRVPVSVFGYGKKSGNNDLFYRPRERRLIGGKKTYQEAQTMEIEEYVAMILTVHFCAVANGAGYSASVPTSGEPPIFFLSKGANLYETLFLSMYPTSEGDTPMWRRKFYLNKVEDVSGWLSLAFHPVRFIAPGDGFDGKTVENVMFGRIQFKKYADETPHPSELTDIWAKYDPFVAIRFIKSKDSDEKLPRPFKYNRRRDMWMSTYELYGYRDDDVDTAAPLIMNTAKMFDEIGVPSSQTLFVLTLATQMEKEPCQAVFDHFANTAGWMFDESAKLLIRDFITFTETCGKQFVYSLCKDGAVIKNAENAKSAQKALYSMAGDYFLHTLIPNVSTMKREECLSYISGIFTKAARDIKTNDVMEQCSACLNLEYFIGKKYKEFVPEGESTA